MELGNTKREEKKTTFHKTKKMQSGADTQPSLPPRICPPPNNRIFSLLKSHMYVAIIGVHCTMGNVKGKVQGNSTQYSKTGPTTSIHEGRNTGIVRRRQGQSTNQSGPVLHSTV